MQSITRVPERASQPDAVMETYPKPMDGSRPYLVLKFRVKQNQGHCQSSPQGFWGTPRKAEEGLSKEACPRPNRMEMQWDEGTASLKRWDSSPQNESRVCRAVRGRTHTDTRGK